MTDPSVSFYFYSFDMKPGSYILNRITLKQTKKTSEGEETRTLWINYKNTELLLINAGETNNLGKMKIAADFGDDIYQMSFFKEQEEIEAFFKESNPGSEWLKRNWHSVEYWL